ncbi:MAG: YfhO family protein [Bacteroidaceae bacterium]|nr:YfhO family protein [Bacteroidaceae bacterium]
MSTTLQKRRPMWLATFLPIALLGLLLIYALNTMLDKSLFASGDGYLMQYTSTVYAKEFWTSLLQGKLPMMDFTNGEGLDPILGMTYYGLADPFHIVYVLVPDGALHVVYSFMTLFKMLLSGLAFGWYAKKQSNDDKAVALGALVYTFSGFMLLWLFSPSVMSACYLFPVALYTMDYAFDRKKFFWFILATAFSYMTNYYVGAAMSFMLLTYAIIRILMAKDWSKTAWACYIKTALAHAIGILTMSMVLVPVLSSILGGARDGTAGGYRDSMLWFNWEYYADFFVGLFTPFDGTAKYWRAPYKMVSHFLCIAAPALVMFLGYKTKPGTKERRLKWTLLACLIFICVPLFSILFNGGMYATHRWLFAYCMVIGMIVVWAGPRWKQMPTWVRITSALLLIGSNVALFWFAIPRVATISLVVSVIVSAIMLIKPRYLTAYIATILSVVTILFSSFTAAGYSVDFSPINVHERPENGIYSAIELTDEELEEFIRVSITDTTIAPNEGLLLGFKTTTGVWNIMPDGICEFNTDAMMFPGTDTDFWVSGWDDRTTLQTLAGAKYFITTEKNNVCAPYGFTHIKSVDVNSTVKHDEGVTTYHIYENNYNVGVGYMLYRNMSTEEFYSIDVASRQLALMQYSVNNHATGESGYNSAVMELFPAVNVEDDGWETNITLNTTVPEGYELYLYLDEAVLLKDEDKVLSRSLEYLEKLQNSQKSNAATTSTSLSSSSHAVVTATNENGDTVSKRVLANRPNAHLTSGTQFRAINLGHNMSGNTTVTIGYYSQYLNINGIKLFAMPLNEYDEAAKQLENNLMYDVEYNDTNGAYISGKVNAKQEGVLQIAVPYSNGWTAYVDGEPAETFVSGIKYIGINMTAGEHEVRIEYHTPGFGWGIMISLTAVFCMAIWFIFEYGAKVKSLFTHPKYASLCRYLVCGCGTTLLDFAIYMGLGAIGIMIPIAKFTSGAITTVVSFFLNRTWSFKATAGNAANQGWKFIITQLLNISTNTLVNSLILSIVDIKLVAFGFATLAGMTVSFLLQRFWVFRQKGEKA